MIQPARFLTQASFGPTAADIDQMGATLGNWFGLSSRQLAEVFPNPANFDASQRNLGFMV